MILRILKIFVLLSVSGFSVFAQQQSLFQNLTSAEGLSQNSVFTIHQDKFGFIWFGTRDGLNKYDGYIISKYYNEPFNNRSLSGNLIQDISEDKSGDLYIATQAGLSMYHIHQDYFQKIRLNPDSTGKDPMIFDLCHDISNNIWIGTDNGLIRYNPENDYVEKIESVNIPNPVTIVYQDSAGSLWLVAKNNLYKYSYENEDLLMFTTELKKYDDQFTGTLCEGPDKRIWLGSSNGVYIADKNSGLVMPSEYFHPWTKSGNFSAIKNIICIGDTIWLGGRNCGLHFIDYKNKTITTLTKYLNPDFNPGAANITSLKIDNINSLWIGTNGSGVLYYNPRKTNLRAINRDNSGIYNQSIRAIYKDKNDILWIGGYRGLDKLNRTTQVKNHYSGLPPNPVLSGIAVYSIIEDPQNSDILWLGYENGGFDLFNKKTGKSENIMRRIARLEMMRNATITHFLFEGEKYVWLSSNNGVLKIDRNYNILKYYSPDSQQNKISDKYVLHLYKDTDNNIWASTAFSGLIKINESENEVITYKNDPYDKNSIISNYVYCCVQDGYGYIWIGTDSGLEKLDPVENNFTHYTTNDGLPNNNIYGILVDEHSHLWLSTNNGMSKFNPRKNTFYNFISSHNLQDREFNTNAFHRSYDNELFFGGIKGINSIYCNDVLSVSDFPEIRLTGFKIFNQKITPGELFNQKQILDSVITSTDKVELDYNQNTISFDFAAMNYFNNESIIYAYMLENRDESWREAGTRRYASYANLPPGNYVFKVKSTNPEGEWNNKHLALKVIINPPFWLSCYAYAFYYLMAAGFVVLLFALYKKKLRKERDELNKQKEIAEKLIRIDKLKDNFLAQVSHEIRTPVNSILNFTSLIESELKNEIDEDLKFGFDSISASGRRITRTVDLLLNFSEIQSGTYTPSSIVMDIFRDILKPIYAEYKILANKKNLEFKLFENAKHPLIKGDNYSIMQIFANLIENAIKYTEEGFIEINVYEKGEKLIVEVKDSGIGISKEFIPDLFNAFTQETEGYTRKFEGNGLGLALVKKYCELNNASISVNSKKGQGTIFSISFPRA